MLCYKAWTNPQVNETRLEQMMILELVLMWVCALVIGYSINQVGTCGVAYAAFLNVFSTALQGSASRDEVS
jgi:hypothetical protein